MIPAERKAVRQIALCLAVAVEVGWFGVLDGVGFIGTVEKLAALIFCALAALNLRQATDPRWLLLQRAIRGLELLAQAMNSDRKATREAVEEMRRLGVAISRLNGGVI